jgi:hypothetical protein
VAHLGQIDLVRRSSYSPRSRWRWQATGRGDRPVASLGDLWHHERSVRGLAKAGASATTAVELFPAKPVVEVDRFAAGYAGRFRNHARSSLVNSGFGQGNFAILRRVDEKPAGAIRTARKLPPRAFGGAEVSELRPPADPVRASPARDRRRHKASLAARSSGCPFSAGEFGAFPIGFAAPTLVVTVRRRDLFFCAPGAHRKWPNFLRGRNYW